VSRPETGFREPPTRHDRIYPAAGGPVTGRRQGSDRPLRRRRSVAGRRAPGPARGGAAPGRRRSAGRLRGRSAHAGEGPPHRGRHPALPHADDRRRPHLLPPAHRQPGPALSARCRLLAGVEPARRHAPPITLAGRPVRLPQAAPDQDRRAGDRAEDQGLRSSAHRMPERAAPAPRPPQGPGRPADPTHTSTASAPRPQPQASTIAHGTLGMPCASINRMHPRARTPSPAVRLTAFMHEAG